MDKDQKNVREFMQKAGQDTPDVLTIPDEATRILRVKILLEEVFEYADAMGVGIYNKSTGAAKDNVNDDTVEFVIKGDVDLVEVADAIADVDYINNGNAIAMGIDMEPVKVEVQRSNMSKFIDGHRRDDGKWVKGPSYSPADVAGELVTQFDSEQCSEAVKGSLRTHLS
jgi:predicted HAD superfamily Cof-like phosphohydrolase